MESGLVNTGSTRSSPLSMNFFSSTHPEGKSPGVEHLIDLFREEQGGAQTNRYTNSQLGLNLKEIKVERSYVKEDESISHREDFPSSTFNAGALTSYSDRGLTSFDRPEAFEALNGRSNASNSCACVHAQGSISVSGGHARVLPVMFSPRSPWEMQDHPCNVSQCEGYQEDQQPSKRSFSGRSSCTTLTGAGYALEGLRFISRTTCSRADQKPQWWEAVERRFHNLASANGRLSKSNFAACIGMEDSEAFAGELFDALSRKKGEDDVDSISLEGLQDYWSQITDDSFHSRAQIFFNLCDKDSDGRIAEEEVKEMIMLSASSNKLAILEEQAEEYASLIMQELDVDKQGYIELSHLESLFRSAAQGYKSEIVTRSSAAISSLIPRAPPLVKRKRMLIKSVLCLNRKAMYFFWDHWQRIWVLACWISTMVALFTWKFFQYKHRTDFQVMGYCVCTAKGAAETLKLNMALILLPVCRNSMTWLRSTILGSIVPFNDNINFHKIIAGGIALGVATHAGSHLGCDFPRIAAADHNMFMETIARDFNYKQPTVMEIVLSLEVMTGIVMVVLMGFAYLLANHALRRNIVKLPWPFHRLTGFNAFWYSHHLFLVVYGILIIHSLYLFLAHDWTQKTTWVYVASPMLLYMGERSLRVFRARQYKVNTVKATTYAGDVLALYMTKPPGFKYESGMYIFLQCPAISPFEWHPFSITSAPGDQYLSVHIRALGDWTREMGKVFREALEYSEKKFKYGMEENEHDPRFPKLCIDGPYGAPAQDYKKYEVLLLVGVGIGATPFISVVKDVLHHIRLAELNLVDLSSNSITSSKSGDSPLASSQNNNYASPSRLMSTPSPRRSKRKLRPLTQAYFYWITREQRSFEWFKGVMNEVAETDQKAVIEMHNYLTSVYEEGDARSALITLVQALHHARNGVDILSGTRVRTHFARPNWQKVFSKIAANHPGSRIGVFYCGPSVLAKELDHLSSKYSQNSSYTCKFEFHKENF